VNLDENIFVEYAKKLESVGGGRIGPATHTFVQWLNDHDVGEELKSFFTKYSPKAELWAGAGTIFDESVIVKWNDCFPSAVKSGLLIIGSGPDGTHIVLDFKVDKGAIGYVSHECNLGEISPRNFYVPVTRTLGRYLSEINAEKCSLPADYREALKLQQCQTS
jgi:hypothetical protein